MLSLIGRAAACALATWLIYAITSRLFDNPLAHMPLTVVFSSAMWAVSFAKFVLPALSAVKNQARHDALSPLSGRHYAFQNHSMRLYLIDEVIWIPVADVAPLLGRQPDARELRYLGADHGTIPGLSVAAYTEAGLLRLLTTRTGTRHATHELIRFKHWLEKEAFPNLRRLPSSSAG
jgi:hypothetical protein